MAALDCQAPTSFLLCDGTNVCLRSIQHEDAPRLQSLFTQLSPESAFFRFLTCWRELNRERAAYLASVDYQTRMAFVATLEWGSALQVIGIASYALLSPHEKGIAEAAVVVMDRYQGLGLGTALLEKLAAYALACKIQTFVGIVHSENERMWQWLDAQTRSGLSVEYNCPADGASDVEVNVGLASLRMARH